MPHDSIKLIPGIDTNETPALNQAGFSISQLIRFKPDRTGKGLLEKIGGWLKYSTNQFSSVSQIWAWQDLANVKRLAVGDSTGIYTINSDSPNLVSNLSPQSLSTDSPYTTNYNVTLTVSSTCTTTIPTSTGMAVVFLSAGGTNITPNIAYYVISSSYTAGTWTFTISTTLGGGQFVFTGSGATTFNFPPVTTIAGSNVITVYDTGAGVASVTFAANIVTVGFDSTGINAAKPPLSTTPVVFYGTSLPAGVTAGATYYVVLINASTYSLTSSLGGAAVTFGSGSGTQFVPNSISQGFNVNFLTPISVANILVTGLYTVNAQLNNSIYSTYQILNSFNASTSDIGKMISYQINTNSNLIVVTQNNQPYINGLTAAILYPTISSGLKIYGNYVVSATSINSFTIFASTSSSAAISVLYQNTLSNGNAYFHLQYSFNLSPPYSTVGYGLGLYGFGGYGFGGGPTVQINTYPVTSTDWTFANFGEILVSSPQGGAIYYWSPTNNTINSFLLQNAPQANQGIFLAMPARQLVAYGSTVTGVQDPLLVRWSDASDLSTWIPTPINQAGSYRIPEGSTIVAAMQAPQQALIWTDISVWSMQYVGPQAVYGFNKIIDGAGAISKKCVGSINNSVYWMSPNKFMMFTAEGPQPLMCPVWDMVFQNINMAQKGLIRCAVNSVFNEITWFYPSSGSISNNSYVKYNLLSQAWDFGTLGRSSWIDESVIGLPLASGTDGFIYQHEVGYDSDTTSMVSYAQTGYMQLNEADQNIFIDQIWPDFKFQNTSQSSTSATLYITFYGVNFPGETPIVYGPYTVDKNTRYIPTRIRNRLVSVRISTTDGTTAALNTFFRIGNIRYRYQLDGKF